MWSDEELLEHAQTEMFIIGHKNDFKQYGEKQKEVDNQQKRSDNNEIK